MKNNIKSKHHTQIGDIGHGQEMIVVKFDKRKYIEFNLFCSKKNLTFSILNESALHILISCNKESYLLFKNN